MSEIRKGINDQAYQIAAFYSFKKLKDETLSLLQVELQKRAEANKILGTILLANEGINGTICGSRIGVLDMIAKIEYYLSSKSLELKFSVAKKQAFRRFKARKKTEIVTIGLPDVDPTKEVGKYVQPLDWNQYLKDPETLVIDTRNDYEIGIGSFKGAVNPSTRSFREFPSWVDKELSNLFASNKFKRIAMFCTGGIRCEKATSYLKAKGYKDVSQLKGGILKYFEDVPEEESLWEGECFVFDQRVSLDYNLLPGEHTLCYACGMPLNRIQIGLSDYIKGIQCCYCVDIFDDQDRKRFAERQKHYDQIEANKE
tara:strand:- start:707 stop:1645 length:939 start_codon:yes stop_codon:yes gene_type:complete